MSTEFTQKWIERAERNDVPIDKVDKFINLWIAFNGWMKDKYGEILPDSQLIKSVKEMENFKDIFEALRKNDSTFANNLLILENCTVINMKYPHNTASMRRYTRNFDALMDTIYSIRCNLLHGRKGTQAESDDLILICLAYDILLPLFKKYLENHY